jgi:TRAP-type mannitol/chloroaromatic compound transport system substrate-binding protein
MNRRVLLAAGTSAGAMLAAPQVAKSQSATRELRMATAWPKGSPGLGANAQRLADMIEAMSGGRLTVRVFAAGELVPALAAFDAVFRWPGGDDAYDAAFCSRQEPGLPALWQRPIWIDCA